ncbi:hypothetical protein [Streptacidiphilus jiangxiensis]|uniref:hypothetical protein n=1 Tax=Streptacidiphilus jiangxiensis TaxID=235985 RepID=UPI000ACD1A38|nr:hypothetical protein [Streptacidiphilus jiangxiensis]
MVGFVSGPSDAGELPDGHVLIETSGPVRDADASERVAAVRGGGGGVLSTV